MTTRLQIVFNGGAITTVTTTNPNALIELVMSTAERGGRQWLHVEHQGFIEVSAIVSMLILDDNQPRDPH